MKPPKPYRIPNSPKRDGGGKFVPPPPMPNAPAIPDRMGRRMPFRIGPMQPMSPGDSGSTPTPAMPGSH